MEHPEYPTLVSPAPTGLETWVTRTSQDLVLLCEYRIRLACHSGVAGALYRLGSIMKQFGGQMLTALSHTASLSALVPGFGGYGGRGESVSLPVLRTVT